MKKFFIVCLFLCLIIGLDTFIIEPNILTVNSKKIYIPNWNTKIDGFKIAVIADIHLGTKFADLDKLEKIVNKTNEYNPDLILLLGDLDAQSIVYKNYKKESIAAILKSFNGKYGTIAIMGNHDYEPENIIRQIYKDANIPLLEHQDLFIYPKKTPLRIVGFKDLWHYKSVPINVIGNKYNNIPTIVLTHNPDSFADMPEFVSLTLSGHTHGGETVFPVIGSFCVPSNYGQRYRKGHIIENGKHLFVSGGIATISHMRLLNPPEIVILELYAQTPKTTVLNTKPITGINKNYAPMVIYKLRNLSQF